ncbi:hypothetical protein HELRODRAFT_181053 [Helobdella robusta]|uniref:SH2 domain-containing protein n=1 Tax=Helobdella robusta TaxID=6412 RepID=T1FGK2_HELRO|nr:hypothetical protein HELRODRAFT_181053 [Helobdella robusta]ESN93305.1 hypothetical protein HELRODRAFT_181053 [Helobdella robusta]
MTPLIEELQKQYEVYNDDQYDTTILDEYPVAKNPSLTPQSDDNDENQDYEQYEKGEDYEKNGNTLKPPPLEPAPAPSLPIPIKTLPPKNAPPAFRNLPPSLPSSPPPNSRAPALTPPLPNLTLPLLADSQPPPLVSRKQKNCVIEKQQNHKPNITSNELCDAKDEYDALEFNEVEYEPDDPMSPPALPPARPVLNGPQKFAPCLPPLKNNNSAKPQTPKSSKEQQRDKAQPPIGRGGFALPVSLEDIQKFKNAAQRGGLQPKTPPQYTSPANSPGPNILKPSGVNTKIANGVANNQNVPLPYAFPVKTAVSPKLISKPPANSNKNTLESNGWYLEIDRKEGEKMLQKSGKNGVFIVRPSAKEPGKPYTLAVYLNGSIKNIPIRKKMNKFALGITEKTNEQTFDSVQDMVKYYCTNKLDVTNQDGSLTEVTLVDSM